MLSGLSLASFPLHLWATALSADVPAQPVTSRVLVDWFDVGRMPLPLLDRWSWAEPFRMHQGAVGCEEGPHEERAEGCKGGRLEAISVVCAVASSVVALPFGTCSWPCWSTVGP